MLHITIDIYKETGKWYTQEVVAHPIDLKLWTEEFRQFIRSHITGQYSGGYVVIHDLPDGEGFHNALIKFDELLPTF